MHRCCNHGGSVIASRIPRTPCPCRPRATPAQYSNLSWWRRVLLSVFPITVWMQSFYPCRDFSSMQTSNAVPHSPSEARFPVSRLLRTATTAGHARQNGRLPAVPFFRVADPFFSAHGQRWLPSTEQGGCSQGATSTVHTHLEHNGKGRVNPAFFLGR